MAAATDTGQAPSVALSRMYNTGAWSDLTIVTATKTFAVHKSVVFASNATFFRAAIARVSGQMIIHMDEPEAVVDAILRHFYELPIEWLEKSPTGPVLADGLLSRGTDCAHLIVAAEKFDIGKLGTLALRRFQICLLSNNLKPKQVVDLGCLWMNLTKDRGSVLYNRGCEIVAVATHQKLAGIVVDALAWKKLYANEAYTRLVMSKAESMVREATKKRPAPDEA
ncbi:unnamed protein product [Zymoseptoria tritici ST99CH_3D7]|uniref:BTB domain-containing protein n=1 Tax=Zymoseptoria tritici (strain ST99CH_3D7) TaxID=1276538 RepID=A0A1X7RYV9_ZYMT9|nr:unnamed protein product [Zymoseptoria tritici ST99CH_3D7]